MADQKMKTVLCFLIRDGVQLLMTNKKRGKGAGVMNVPGGKVGAGESDEAALKRLLKDRTGLVPGKLEKIGHLEFYFPQSEFDNDCTVYISTEYTGTHTPDTKECTSEWVQIAAIDLAKRWESDKKWFPLVFAKKPFHQAYWYNKNGKIIEEKVIK